MVPELLLWVKLPRLLGKQVDDRYVITELHCSNCFALSVSSVLLSPRWRWESLGQVGIFFWWGGDGDTWSSRVYSRRCWRRLCLIVTQKSQAWLRVLFILDTLTHISECRGARPHCISYNSVYSNWQEPNGPRMRTLTILVVGLAWKLDEGGPVMSPGPSFSLIFGSTSSASPYFQTSLFTMVAVWLLQFQT